MSQNTTPFRNAFIKEHRWVLCGWVINDGSPDSYLLPQIAHLDKSFPDAKVVIGPIFGSPHLVFTSDTLSKRYRVAVPLTSPSDANFALAFVTGHDVYKIFFEPLNHGVPKPFLIQLAEVLYNTDSLPFSVGPIPLMMLNEKTLDEGSGRRLKGD